MPPQVVVDPAEVRPRRKWFWIAGIIAGVGIIVGVGGGVGLFVFGATSMTPDTRTTLSGSGTATGSVRLTADAEWAIFSTTDASWDVQCAASAGGDQATVTAPDETVTFTTGGSTWHEVARVKAPSDGAYAFTCRPVSGDPGSDASGARYLVGEAPELGAFFGGLFGGFALLFGVPFVAVLAAVIISVVTGVRRSDHRRRLIMERGGYRPPPGPPAYRS